MEKNQDKNSSCLPINLESRRKKNLKATSEKALELTFKLKRGGFSKFIFVASFFFLTFLLIPAVYSFGGDNKINHALADGCSINPVELLPMGDRSLV